MIRRTDIIAALEKAGVSRGMTVFSHANIAFFGRAEGADTMEALIALMLDCFTDLLGKEGTLVLPVFTYSFGSDKTEKVFDRQNSLSTTSGMGNWMITSGKGFRSADPMLSVVAVGGKAKELTADVGPVCFGNQSIWSRLYAEDALICNLNLDSGSTLLHWVEREVGVPYRADITMTGTIIDQGAAREAEIVYTGRALDDKTATPKFEAYHQACVGLGVSTLVPLGRGQIVTQRVRAAKSTLIDLLASQPRILTAGHSS